MTPLQVVVGVLVGFVAGMGSGLFGVGGGTVTTPAINVLLGGTAIQAVATPLPVMFPTSVVGAFTYGRAGEVSYRAFRWAVGPGIVGAIAGAAPHRGGERPPAPGHHLGPDRLDGGRGDQGPTSRRPRGSRG